MKPVTFFFCCFFAWHLSVPAQTPVPSTLPAFPTTGYIAVGTESALNTAISNISDNTPSVIELTDDITLSATITIQAHKQIKITGNGHYISGGWNGGLGNAKNSDGTGLNQAKDANGLPGSEGGRYGGVVPEGVRPFIVYGQLALENITIKDGYATCGPSNPEAGNNDNANRRLNYNYSPLNDAGNWAGHYGYAAGLPDFGGGGAIWVGPNASLVSNQGYPNRPDGISAYENIIYNHPTPSLFLLQNARITHCYSDPMLLMQGGGGGIQVTEGHLEMFAGAQIDNCIVYHFGRGKLRGTGSECESPDESGACPQYGWNMCNGFGGGVAIYGNSSFEMYGGEIRNNIARDNWYYSGGGGVFMGAYAAAGTPAPVMKMYNSARIHHNRTDCRQNDEVWGSGGGVYKNVGDLYMYDNALIDSCKSSIGGGVMQDAGDLRMFDDTKITHNDAFEDEFVSELNFAQGGGVFSWSPVFMNGNSEISFNRAQNTQNVTFTNTNGTYRFPSLGGGIYMAGSDLTMSDNAKIHHNTVGNIGGGVFLGRHSDYTGGKLIMYNQSAIEYNNTNNKTDTVGVLLSTLSPANELSLPNWANDGSFTTYFPNHTINKMGGGVFMVGNTQVLMYGGSINNNTAGGAGGGIGVDANFSETESIITDGTATINNNTAGEFGGGVYLFRGGKMLMKGSSKVEYNRTTDEDEDGVALASPAPVTERGGGGIMTEEQGVINITEDAIVQYNSTENTSPFGGGILLRGGTNTTNPTVLNINADNSDTGEAHIQNNSATQSGGGIAASSNSVITLGGNGHVNNNRATAYSGGGIALYGTANGAKLYAHDNSVIEKNSTGGSGGGIGVYAGSTTNAYIELSGNAKVYADTASVSGGGIYATSIQTVDIKGSAIVDGNRSLGTSSNGGGGVALDGTAILNVSGDAEIRNNISNCDGGGIGKASRSNTAVTVNLSGNSKVHHNSTTHYGGGVFAYLYNITMNDNASIYNNSISLWHNTDATGGGVCLWSANMNMNDNSAIYSNSSNSVYGGGGVAVKTGSNLIMRNFSQIGKSGAGNSGNGQGAGVCLQTTTSVLKMYNNSSIGYNTNGQGIYSLGGQVYMYDNSEIHHHDIASAGAGIRMETNPSTNKVYMYNNSSIHHNRTNNAAGGVCMENTGMFFQMNDNASIHDNESYNSGGWGGGVLVRGTFEMNGYSSVYKNIKQQSGYGGGIMVADGSQLTMNGYSKISENSIFGCPTTLNNNFGGGGVFLYNNSKMTMNEHSEVSDNYANARGGGIFLDKITTNAGGLLTIKDQAKISNNTAGTNGGGIYTNNYAGIVITSANAVFTGNRASKLYALKNWGVSKANSGNHIPEYNLGSTNSPSTIAAFNTVSQISAPALKNLNAPTLSALSITETDYNLSVFNNYDINYEGDEVFTIVYRPGDAGASATNMPYQVAPNYGTAPYGSDDNPIVVAAGSDTSIPPTVPTWANGYPFAEWKLTEMSPTAAVGTAIGANSASINSVYSPNTSITSIGNHLIFTALWCNNLVLGLIDKIYPTPMPNEPTFIFTVRVPERLNSADVNRSILDTLVIPFKKYKDISSFQIKLDSVINKDGAVIVANAADSVRYGDLIPFGTLKNGVSYKMDTKENRLDVVNSNGDPLTGIQPAFGIKLSESSNLPQTDENYHLKAGVEYYFSAHYNNPEDESVCSHNVPFRIKVVPDTIIWTPTGNNDSWHNDLNWKYIPYHKGGVHNEPDSASVTGFTPTRAFVPLPETHVIIPSGSAVYSTLYDTISTYDTQNHVIIANQKATNFIEYDVNFRKNSATEVHFKHDAELANQYFLDYDSAKVDLPIETWRWYGIAAPLHNMYSGDFAQPLANPMVSMQLHDRDNPQYGYVETAWTGAFNTSDVPLTAGTGFALRVSDKYYGPTADWISPTDHELGLTQNASNLGAGLRDTASVVYYFPKNNNTFKFYDTYFHYHNSDYDQSLPLQGRDFRQRFIYETQEYDGTAIKRREVLPTVADPALLTTARVTSKKKNSTVVVGNPLMSHIDFLKFRAANASVINNEYKLLVNNDGITFKYISSIASPSPGEDGILITSDNTLSDSTIAPMQLFLLTVTTPENRSADDADKIDINFPRDMSVTNPANDARLRSSKPTEHNIIRIRAERNGLNTACAVAFNPLANDRFVSGEDSRLMIIESSDNMPHVFTVSDDIWLDINQLSTTSQQIIPIGIADAGRGETRLTITGTETLTGSDEVIFRDAVENKEIAVKQGFTYTFNNTSGNTVGRFYLILRDYTGISDSAPAGQLKIYSSDRRIFIVSPDGKPILSASIVGMDGRTVWQPTNTGKSYIEATVGQAGAYIVKANTENGIEVRKVIVQR